MSTPTLIVIPPQPAQPERRVLVVVQCWFCNKRWALSPLPEHDEVWFEEGFCPNGCDMESAFFGEGKRRKAAL